jgi:hypothetical protein
VLPVGGIKEKVLAAHRAGVKRVILPERNVADLEEVPAEIQQELEFIGPDEDQARPLDPRRGQACGSGPGELRSSALPRERPVPVGAGLSSWSGRCSEHTGCLAPAVVCALSTRGLAALST